MSGLLAFDENAMVANSSALSNGMSCVLTSTPGIAVRILSARYSSAGKRWLSICTVAAARAGRMKGRARLAVVADSRRRRVVGMGRAPSGLREEVRFPLTVVGGR